MIRGFTIDAARLVEPMPTYHRFVELMAGWGYDTLLLRLTDDQGSAFRFASHPELVTHRHAFGERELRALCAHANDLGIEVIPEIESFGHARYIVDTPEHALLADGPPPEAGRIVYNSISPVDPASLALIAGLYAEIAAIVPGRYLHGGCDEVDWGRSEESRRAIAERGREAVWTGYINQLAAAARAVGRELIIWADHVLRPGGSIAGLDPAIILHDWDYWTTEAAPLRARAELGIAHGHRIIGGPGAIYARWGARGGVDQLANLQAHANAHRGLDRTGSLGIIVADWLPTRVVPWANLDLVALAGACLAGADLGDPTQRERAFAGYVERHFAADWREAWRSALADLYRLAPSRHRGGAADPPELIAPWADHAAVRELCAHGAPIDPGYAGIAAGLATLAPAVRGNQEDFAALALTVDYLAHLWWRAAAIVDACASAHGRTEKLSAIARADAELVARLERQWRTARFADDLEPDPRAWVEMHDPRDHLHHALRVAAAFSAELAADPARLDQLTAVG